MNIQSLNHTLTATGGFDGWGGFDFDAFAFL
jgi:hypothetical protein